MEIIKDHKFIITSKVRNRGWIGIFVAYAKNHGRGVYRFLNLENMTIRLSRDIRWLYKIYGGGHDWPGSQGANMDIDASLEVWLFFEHIMNNSLGINNNSDSANFIHPNPAKDFFSISSSRAYLKYEIF